MCQRAGACWSLCRELRFLDSNVVRCAYSKDSCEQVQAHGVQPVEFSLWLSAQEREAPYIEQTCGRLDHFCPGEQRLVNRTISVFGTGEDLESAAPRAAAGGGGAALLLVLGAVVFGRRLR